jgi:hypothetical protein
MAKDGNPAQAKANEGKAQAKAKGGKPKACKPNGGKAKVDKTNYEDGDEMEGGVEGVELKSNVLNHPRGGPTMEMTLGKLHLLMPEMSKESVRKVVEPFIIEYFENGHYDVVLQGRSIHYKRRWMQWISNALVDNSLCVNA